MVGVIYILTNPSFPDYVKIGYASDIERRLQELNRSEAIPFAFRVYAIYETNGKLTDVELHKLIDTLNPDLRSIETFDGKKRMKEFYAMSAEDAYSILESIAKISGTEDKLKRMDPAGHEILDEQIAQDIKEKAEKKIEKLPSFRFSMVGIARGEMLQYIKDPSIEVRVVDDRHIEYRGKTYSCSGLAKELLHVQAVQGPAYFCYHGRTLAELREIENQQSIVQN